MKLVRATSARLVFHLGRRETRLLHRILQLYPCVPSAHHVLSKSSGLPNQQADQQLLDEALAEHRADNRKQVLALLADSQRFARTKTGCRLSLPPAEAEWLLQVLNDVRVGSWISLGSPEEKAQTLNETTAPHFLAMEIAGYFQAELLEALHRET
jgi:hypothetical protein